MPRCARLLAVPMRRGEGHLSGLAAAPTRLGKAAPAQLAKQGRACLTIELNQLTSINQAADCV